MGSVNIWNIRASFVSRAALVATLAMGLMPGRGWSAGPVINPYAYPTPPGVENAAVYFELHNDSSEPLVLTGATADGVGSVQIHRHQQTSGMMGMRRQAQVELGAGETVSFAPGAYHLMLLGLVRPLHTGESVRLQLQFAGDETLSVTAPVIELGSQPGGMGHGSMRHGMGDGEH